MALVSLKGVGTSSLPESSESEEYAWGTRLCLNDDIVEALKAEGYKVGDVVSVTALAVVTSKHDRMDGGADHDGAKEVDTSLDLQITDLGVSKPQAEASKAAVLFPSMASKS